MRECIAIKSHRFKPRFMSELVKGHVVVPAGSSRFLTFVGTFFFTQGRDVEPTYRDITDGAWLDDSPYGVVHRIAADGSEKGIGSFCLEWACGQIGHLRIDTHGDNTVMQNLLRKQGFVRCGTIHVEEDDDPRLAFEKSPIISPSAREDSRRS